MRIERFRIQGYKSIVDLAVDGLSDVNVFFGLNNVGKSNIFEALNLWRELFTRSTNKFDIDKDELRLPQWKDIFHLDSSGIIKFDVDLIVEKLKARSQIIIKKIIMALKGALTMRLSKIVNIDAPKAKR